MAPTPRLALDLKLLRERYRALREAVPRADVCYAVKANPSSAVLSQIVALGGGFDVASAAELRACLRAGASPSKCSFGNTMKREDDLAEARSLGVELFVFDSRDELEKLARLAPGASVYCRLAVGSSDAAWPLSRKFGASPEVALRLLRLAATLGLRPRGASLHVGSQQRSIAVWSEAARLLASVLAAGRADGLPLELANLGGGLPAAYDERDVPSLHVAAISEAVAKHLREVDVVMIEPGRHLIAESGVLESTVLALREEAGSNVLWAHLDAGRYNGLCEGDTVHYPVSAWRGGERLEGALRSVLLAGPTCDSDDYFGTKLEYRVPEALRAGDRLRFHSCGAYVTVNELFGFNGVPQPVTELLGEELQG